MNTQLRNMDVYPVGGRPGRLMTTLEELTRLPENPVGGRAGLTIGRIVRAINAQVEAVEEERQRLVDVYGVRDEDGNLLRDGEGVTQVKPQADADFLDLLRQTFEVETLPVSQIRRLDDIPTYIIVGLGDLLYDDVSENGNTEKMPVAQPPRRKRR
ncbi:MAG: hypothetical protein DCC55_30815 [Chloroflexi bacterium]|nr:MAG: hypothetical protein DCC55_30815 [Chloroflexota bacterium]